MTQRFQQQAQERAVRIDVSADARIVAQIGRGPASLVVANLIDNAVKFSPAGGAITVRLSESGDDAVVAVTDDGPGIQQDDLPRVFDRFYRGQNARLGTAPGVGLGLALAQAIVRAHGGRIEVFNQARPWRVLLRAPAARVVFSAGYRTSPAIAPAPPA